jgi:hypothetical protein
VAVIPDAGAVLNLAPSRVIAFSILDPTSLRWHTQLTQCGATRRALQ